MATNEVITSGSGVTEAARLQNIVTAANDNGASLTIAANRTTSGLTDIARVTGLIADISQSAYKGALVFSTADGAAPAERVRIDSTGRMALTGQLDISGASAGQVAFPSTQNPSSGPNVLDDYAEGVWSPSVGGNATYTTQIGTYTKIGRQVTAYFRLKVNTLGTGSGSTISNLPFSSGGTNYPGVIGFFENLNVNTAWVGCYTSGSTIVFTTQGAIDGSCDNGTAILTNSAEVMGSITYFV